MTKKYDMHCHTKYSDGKLDIEELVPLAEKKGLRGFCVTDHDTLDGSKMARSLSTNKVEVIPGVELSCKLRNYMVEILGYFVDPSNEKLLECCRINQEFRSARMGNMIYEINKEYNKELREKYREKGFDKQPYFIQSQEREDKTSKPYLVRPELTLDEVIAIANNNSIGLNHINQALVNRGLFKGREAFMECLEKNTPRSCYIEREAVKIDHGIDSILDAGGVVSIPHPALVPMDYPDLTDETFIEMIKDFLGKKIKAIEVFYPYGKVRPECRDRLANKEKYYAKFARTYGLLPMGGSDGHQKHGGPSIGERKTFSRTIEQIRKLAHPVMRV